jgi:Mrp family chromosome partitioning ATPase
MKRVSTASAEEDENELLMLKISCCSSKGLRSHHWIEFELPSHRDSEHRGRTNFADRIVQTPRRGVEFLRLLPAGGYDRQMLDRLRDVIADTADEFDLIVIDDGLESGLLRSPRFLDNVIMVVESGHTRRDQLQEGLEAVKQSRAKITGAVLAA